MSTAPANIVVAMQETGGSAPLAPLPAPAVHAAPGDAGGAIAHRTVQRARALVSRALPMMQYRLMRSGPAGMAGVAALAAALGLGLAALLPAEHSLQSLQGQIAQLPRGAGATHGAADAMDGFVAALPTRAQMPAVLGQMLEQADKAQVSLEQGHYSYSAAQSGKLARYAFEFPIKGDYPRIRAFVGSTLLAIPAAGLDKLTIERKNVGDSSVDAVVRFVIFLKPE